MNRTPLLRTRLLSATGSRVGRLIAVLLTAAAAASVACADTDTNTDTNARGGASNDTAARAPTTDWPAWRGPSATGVAHADDPPTQWSAEDNIAWKTKLPAWSGSTPIITGDRIFLLSPSAPEQADSADANAAADGDDSRRGRRNRRGRGGGGRGAGGDDILLLCLDRNTGDILWQKKIDDGNAVRMKQNASSPSPVSDGEHVFAVSGNGAVAAFDLEGDEQWRFDIEDAFGRIGLGFGYASSPLLHDGLLICQVLHGQRTDDPSYVFALDAKTGERKWHIERPTDAQGESPDAYTTPALLEHEGRAQIVILGGDYITGHDPQTGKELWRSGGLNPRGQRNYRIVPSPVVAGGMIFAPTRKTPFLAIKPGGEGDVTRSHRAWTWDGPGAPDVPTPAADGEHLYVADDRGSVTILDAASGETVWGPQSTNLGSVSASPVLAGGRLYVLSERGETAVVQVEGERKVLGVNQLDGSYTLSSPAVADGQIFIRTSDYLYCIGR